MSSKAKTLSIPVANFVPDPTAPSVTPAVPGTSTWGYKIVGEAADGSLTLASSEGTTVLGAVNLSGVDFNTVTWTDPLNAAFVHIYRSTNASDMGHTPTTLGYIGRVAAGVQTFDDTGLAGDGSPVPDFNTTGASESVNTIDMSDLTGHVDGDISADMQFQGKIDPNAGWANVGDAISAAGIVNLSADAPALSQVRLIMTSYTSGTATAAIAGH